MKTAKPPAPEGSSSSNRRSQPVRQTRTNPPRTTALNRNHAPAGGLGHEQPVEIFPAVTHFADAITALPKELVRHFTLLKEVDAKIFGPEEALFKLIEATLNAPATEPARSHNDASSSGAPNSAPMSAQNSSSGAVPDSQFPRGPSTDESTSMALFDPSNMPRRHLFRQTAYKIQEMLVSLEEKNHVISTANDALQKQLDRVEDLWPHLEGEFSDEAKWGSTTHWAYLENRVAKSNNTQAERSRREGAATLSAAAQQLADEAAARSSDRKQALAAKKNSRNQAADADGDGKQHEQSKKSQGSGKSRKPAADSSAGVGLGISTAGGSNGNPAPKRRKVENKANGGGGAATERAMSTVFGPNASKPRTTSPRETPGPDGPSKKRKALPTSSSQSKKRFVPSPTQVVFGKSISTKDNPQHSRTGAAMSPSVASSPVLGNFPDPSKPGRGSPAPANSARPASSRARQNSTQSSADNGRQRRPSSSASNKPNGGAIGASDAAAAAQNGSRASNDGKSQKENTTASKTEVKTETEAQSTPSAPISNGNKKENTASKPAEESEAKRDASMPAPPAIPVPTVTTKSGRASKPSTPALATFAEAASARSRPSRAGDGSHPPAKRSHKKGASAAAAAAMAVAAQQAAAEGDRSTQDDEEEDADIDGDEPRYCYCNNVSYGEMVACDADGCKREWFHLECVGLKVAPKGNGKSSITSRYCCCLVNEMERAADNITQRNGTVRTARSGSALGAKRPTRGNQYLRTIASLGVIQLIFFFCSYPDTRRDGVQDSFFMGGLFHPPTMDTSFEILLLLLWVPGNITRYSAYAVVGIAREVWYIPEMTDVVRKEWSAVFCMGEKRRLVFEVQSPRLHPAQALSHPTAPKWWISTCSVWHGLYPGGRILRST